ncbi:MAG: hypothetical protein D6723_02960 [Acidobacteria bacterium]|nr:MAG: hypothetical protein D6723_02960 [Acidobacteriota bacterium]
MNALMRRTNTLWLRLTILALVAGLTPFPWGGRLTNFNSHALAQGAEDYEPGMVIVQLAPMGDPVRVARRHGLEIIEPIDERFWLMGIPDERTVPEVVRQLTRDREVRSAEPNRFFELPEVNPRTIIHVDGEEAAGDFREQAALSLMRVAEAQHIADGSGIVVAVIDTGVDAGHPELLNVGEGYDFVDEDDDPSEEGEGDGFGHGTMIAGLITLIAPGVTIMPVRAFGPDGRGTTVDIARAIRFAADHGADIVNLSFGTVDQPQAIRGAINYARSRAILVASAGNDDADVAQYPASDNQVVAVASTDLEDHKALFSNYGFHINVSAPGVHIVSAYPNGRYATGDGTSFSTAFVSGAIALVMSAGSRDPVKAVEDAAVDIDPLNPDYRGLLGRGRLDVYAAVFERE